MARYRRYSKRQLKAEMNIVPYVDVMFVLLTIFMVTASVVNLGVDVDLPQAAVDSARPSEPEMLVLSIDDGGRFYLNMAADAQAPLTDEALIDAARVALSARPELPVLVKADQSIDYGRVIRGMELLQQAGAPRVGLSTAPREG